MNCKRSGIAAVAVLMVTFSATADAAMMRAFWAGNITDAIEGNAYDLAVGDKIHVEMMFDTNWLTALTTNSFSGEPLEVSADFLNTMPSQLGLAETTPSFTGVIRFLDNMGWEAVYAGQVIATGDWSTDSIKFSPRVIPVPAAFPLLVGALGILGMMRRRT